ncbi:uncharacterized protein LOC136090491 [Hydra vulgaris]|uniref:HECT-type E3 ubiquitin transferase n=1 Tax=Hydra vulgaris TaxID=6087 RepID=A0ABM4DFR2_HYDVU
MDSYSKVASLLEEASILLRTNQSTNISRPQSELTITSTLQRARGMLNESGSSGIFRRLNRNDRLRSSAPYSSNIGNHIGNQNKSKKMTKTLEFALISSTENDEEQFLKWDSMNSIFVKVSRKKISKLNKCSNIDYSYDVVKKLAGQGLLYLQLKERCNDHQMIIPTEVIEIPSASFVSKSSQLIDQEDVNEVDIQEIKELTSASFVAKGSVDKNIYIEIDFENQKIKEIKENNLQDPIEILRFLQKTMIKGRVQDIEYIDENTDKDSETNFIFIDRQNILMSTFAELESVENFLITFEVDFMGELAKDYGGPRREWIRECNRMIKERLFDSGLRELFAEEYYFVGLLIGIALFQGGQLPTYLPDSIIIKITENTADICISNIQKGLNKFNLIRFFKEFPQLLELLRPSKVQFTAKMLLKLLKPKSLVKEKEIYSMFVKYVREVASGRRECVSLANILSFVTGASEEPLLGFALQPSVEFIPTIEADEKDQKTHEAYMYIPTAHTCSNCLVLPRGWLLCKLPANNDLFDVYDMAFTNNFFETI